jgi:hypothetical protein
MFGSPCKMGGIIEKVYGSQHSIVAYPFPGILGGLEILSFLMEFFKNQRVVPCCIDSLYDRLKQADLGTATV